MLCKLATRVVPFQPPARPGQVALGCEQCGTIRLPAVAAAAAGADCVHCAHN